MKEEGEMSFLDHLEVFRWHLIRAVAAILFFSLTVTLAETEIFSWVVPNWDAPALSL